jgi:hypothetical protein
MTRGLLGQVRLETTRVAANMPWLAALAPQTKS